MCPKTPEQLIEHARRCFKMSQLAVYINSFSPSPEMEKAIMLWHKAGKRAEYRADCIWSGKDDPALFKFDKSF